MEKLQEEIIKYREPDTGFVTHVLNPGSGTVTNGLLFSAEYLMNLENIPVEEALWYTDAVCRCFSPVIDRTRLALALYRDWIRWQPCSFDDFIAIAALLPEISQRPLLQTIYNVMETQNWQNGTGETSDLRRFRHMISYVKYRATGKCNLFDQLMIAGNFIENLFREKGETSGKCMNLLIADTMYGAFWLVDRSIDLWRSKMRKMYPPGRREIYAIYFGSQHALALYGKEKI